MAGRTVIISGGGTGIGLATARAFARDGDTSVLIGRRAEVVERAAASVGNAVALPADLTDPAEAARVARFVAERFGTVDVLVHSAGGSGLLEPRPDDADDADDTGDPLAAAAHHWTVAFRINTLTAVLLTEALRDRLASPGGRVLFLSSIAAYRGSGSGAYAASKAALHPYAFDLARALGPRGVTVNVVAPGYIEETEFFGPAMPPERREARVAETLNARAGTPGDVAETLRWLASHAASHITSQTIQVNGGAERGH
ncbi:SDR family NAD(P)-dependent oxidoreductase [Streptomyces sp. NBC_01803]|uniref:SDR family NAD(P)-dependent oxidoreductase n=1 Tax=Streptomyces sp. NBC_01803 TaxID=2975946 RepID=UPI002DD87E38|nr:SDR family oxidoreductase [Streptomyces sp. NBC_01803]WSA45339.1 SDR family oxidoreductase [Streptomyces sp. NBC_01803]